jgi:MFS family permease
MPDDSRPANYRWYILALSTVTASAVVAIPFSCMPSLFKEISQDLDLSLVEIGTIWGIANLAGVFVSLIGGLMSDRMGTKMILTVSCILVGITGAARGLSNGFFILTLTVFVNGLVRAIVPIINTKTIGVWFKGKNLALANGIGAMGMGLGLMLGPMISATLLSPWLGGWRNVLFLYGAIGVVLGVLWFLFSREPPQAVPTAPHPETVSIGQTLSKLVRVKGVWLLGIMLMFRSGCMTGVMGYVPLYLRDIGLSPAVADNTLAVFFASSTIFVVPLSSLSDRLKSRKAILIPSIVISLVCVALLPLSGGIATWILMIVAGLSFDGFMAIFCAMILETEGIGPAYYGTALGLVFTISQVGGVISPPLGNSLAAINAGLPFYFWAGLCGVSLVFLFFIKETLGKKGETV